MSTDLRDQIRAQILIGLWQDLKDHASRGSVFIVEEELDLAEVGYRVASDDVTQVGRWIEDKSIERPSPEQIKTWDAEPAKSFRFVIVQPYVLIQESPH